jgi:3-methyladenine DNA glycosylase/8-oxoguanine DNA glycosylase
MELERKSNQELMTTDVFSLDDRALKQHIRHLQSERNELKRMVVPSVSECNAMISLASAELSGRASDRLGKRAIWLSMVAVVLAAISFIWQIVVP